MAEGVTCKISLKLAGIGVLKPNSLLQKKDLGEVDGEKGAPPLPVLSSGKTAALCSEACARWDAAPLS